MPIDLFKKVVKKAKTEGYDNIGIYNWTEPFLAKTLPEYISVVKDCGLFCEVSSNLSLKPQEYLGTIERSLVAGIDRLLVSVSGYSQAVYEINHVGGNISWVKENLEAISRLKREGSISARIFIKFIKFDYNSEEELALKEYANSLGLDFEVIEGAGHPSDIPIIRYCSEEDRVSSCGAEENEVTWYNTEESFRNGLKNFTPTRIYEKSGEICFLVMDTVSIDCEGDVYLCCAYPNVPPLRIGPYLGVAKDDLLLKRYTHPVCASCPFPRRKATGNDWKALANALKSRLGISDGLPGSDLNRLSDEHTQKLESLLKENEMILNNIYQSRGWKALLIYYRIRDKIFRR